VSRLAAARSWTTATLGRLLGREGAAVALVVLASAVPYLSTLRYPFLNWDDYPLILEHPHIRGFTWDNLRAIFTPGVYGAYQPVRDLSYMLDYARGGLDPAAYHQTNILLYGTTNLAVLVLLRAIGFAFAPALVAALAFALHPVHVEGVAWLAARKEVLAGTFFFACAATYLMAARAAGKRAAALYAGAFTCGVLAALSKPITVTLPGVLFLLEWLVLKTRGGRAWGGAALRILPFLLLSGVMTAITIGVSIGGDVLKALPPGGFGTMMLTWPLTLVSYLRLLVWPANLITRYDNVYVFSWADPLFVLSMMVLGILVGFTIVVRRAWPSWLLATLWFGVTLLPVSNFVPISTLVADRYVFLPSFAVAVVIASIASVAWERGRTARVAALAVACGLLAMLGTLTFQGVRVWRDSVSLWRNVVEKEPYNVLGRYAYANVQAQAGNYDAAIHDYLRALQRDSTATFVLSALGNCYLVTGRLDRAEKVFRRALAVDSMESSALVGLADALYLTGQADGAVAAYDRALAAKAPRVRARTGRVLALFDLGRHDDAIRGLRQMMAEDPNTRRSSNYLLLGQIYVAAGRNQEALAALEHARSLGDGIQATAEFANTLIAARRFEETRAVLAQALSKYGNACRLFATLGDLAVAQGDSGAAFGWYRRAVIADSAAAPAWTALADLQFARSQFAAAESSYGAAARWDPSGRALINLGIFRLRRGELVPAESAFVQAERKIGEDADLLYNRACLETRRDRNDRALALLKRAALRGYRGAAGIERDPDLVAIRARPEFAAFAARVRSNDAAAPRRSQR
jgi:tetratricopeptide (TPR) repeat protein